MIGDGAYLVLKSLLPVAVGGILNVKGQGLSNDLKAIELADMPDCPLKILITTDKVRHPILRFKKMLYIPDCRR